MGIYKTPKDNPVDAERPGSVATRLLDGAEAGQARDPQRVFPQTSSTAQADPSLHPSQRVQAPTRLVGPGGASAPTAASEPMVDPATDPIAGWLVVVQGPGRGAFCRVGYQVNSIGRAPENRIVLDFGDDGISRQNHAQLIYDPRSRAFYLERGDGANLCYLNDRPVGRDLTEIPPNAKISLSQTDCVLVPFCGPSFDWCDKSYVFGMGARPAPESGS